MRTGYAADAYPYTPAVGLLNGLKLSTEMLLTEGLEAVFARHAAHRRRGARGGGGWGLQPCALRPELFPTRSRRSARPGVDAGLIVTHAARDYGMAFGTGLGDVAGKVFRIGHLGSLTDAMALSGIATAEMVMADLGLTS